MAKDKPPRQPRDIPHENGDYNDPENPFRDTKMNPQSAGKRFDGRKLKAKMPDIFANTTKRSTDMGGKERWRHEIELLQLEWAVKHPLMAVTEFLREVKGYSEHQAVAILKRNPLADWKKAHGEVLDKLTETVVKRHIDLIAEVQDTHVKASKLGLAKALEMLTKMQLYPMKDKKGNVMLDENGKPFYRGFRSIDLLNCLSAIEKAQQIYRRAMGLPNEEAGLSQILEKIESVRQETYIQNNVQVNIPAPTDELGKKLAELKYEDVMELIERRRELKRIAAAQEAEDPSEKVH